MPLLAWPGVLRVPVPDGWTVAGDPGDVDGAAELEPDTGDGAVRLAAFDRRSGPLGEHEGRDRLTELLAEVAPGADARTRIHVYRDCHRGFAWFPSYDADGHDLDCLASVTVTEHSVIVLLARAGVRSRVISAAEVMAASVTPG